ncbi:Hypothetical predicted protein [Paramuricea clavata]|uniref:Uncharacterized protein n=1 Tax=Paramuricea clavata TaxID=317549 RepID=A0A7D9H8M9_PARCT|nr:Hypothetical predicted protein [Paramuricea clavata]
MVNVSLTTGHFPNAWKEALVSPLFQKGCEDMEYKNLRPISNLQFVSKITERAASDQIYNHIVANNVFPPLQSAYRKHHSTETALLKVINGIHVNMNNQQGSCLGPLLFTVYASKLFEVVKHHLPNAYADDTKLYLAFKPETTQCQEDAMEAMEKCIKADVYSVPLFECDRYNMTTEITRENSEIINEQNSEASLENIQPTTTLQIESSEHGEEIVLLKRQKHAFKAKLTRLKHQIEIEKLCITDSVEVTEVESKVEQLWENLEETHEVIDKITQYYITVGQLEKQLESSKESDDIEAEISKAIENAQS